MRTNKTLPIALALGWVAFQSFLIAEAQLTPEGNTTAQEQSTPGIPNGSEVQERAVSLSKDLLPEVAPLRKTLPPKLGGSMAVPNPSKAPPPVLPPMQITPPRSVRDLLLQIQSSPGGIQLLREAESRSAPIQGALAMYSTTCTEPGCIEATLSRPENYYGNWNLWGQNGVWSNGQQFLMRPPTPTDGPLFRRGNPLLVFQVYRGGWHVINFELCSAWLGQAGRYSGPVQATLRHGPGPTARVTGIFPSVTTVVTTWQYTMGTSTNECKSFPALVELVPGNHAFIFELEVGALELQRVTFRVL